MVNQTEFKLLQEKADMINNKYNLFEFDHQITVKMINQDVVEIEHFTSRLQYHTFEIAMNRLNFIEQFCY